MGSLVCERDMARRHYTFDVALHNERRRFVLDGTTVDYVYDQSTVRRMVVQRVEESVRALAHRAHQWGDPNPELHFDGKRGRTWAQDKAELAELATRFTQAVADRDALGSELKTTRDTLATVRSQLEHAQKQLQNAAERIMLLERDNRTLQERLAPKTISADFGQPAPRRLVA